MLSSIYVRIRTYYPLNLLVWLTLPEASRIWQISGILLFVESVSYTLIDNVIKNNHLQLFFVFFIAIIMTVAATIILEYRNCKLQ